MGSASWDQRLRQYVRADFDAALTAFFETSVAVDDRTYEVFQVTVGGNSKEPRQDKQYAPLAPHIWRSLREQIPLMWTFHEAIGYNPAARPNPQPRTLTRLDPTRHPIWMLDWTRTLRDCFMIRNKRETDQLVSAAAAIRATGQLSAVNLATAILQSGSIGYRFTPEGSDRVRKVNLVLRHLLVATGRGKHIEYSDAVAEFEEEFESVLTNLIRLDPSYASQQFILYEEGGHFRLRPFGVFDGFRPADVPLADGSLWVARSNVLQPLGYFSEEAIGELERLINSGAPELAFQSFFEANPEFILSLGPWKRMHPQLVLHRDEGQLIPDLFLERLDSDFVDLCDLKRPTAELVRQQRNRVRFRDAVMEAVAQLRLYRDWFDDRTNREAFRREHGLRGFRPRVVVIIGRRQSYYDEIERIRLESGLPEGVSLKTFDDVLTSAKRWRNLGR